ncbi:Uncharacterised protein [Vibrio cholerae]|uniref:Uncharacterized protein n=1 Tax=Vibrio cholerae TaxID=666 RepID=A0A656ABV9_VIBCL|nr:Uncharacterised protein [Vibrio cholerae]CSD01189.1 Uncharacterised protein [Vibrio cholerae]CSI54771.1 Uncharacterised protein [Vibrio cholerae]
MPVPIDCKPQSLCYMDAAIDFTSGIMRANQQELEPYAALTRRPLATLSTDGSLHPSR